MPHGCCRGRRPALQPCGHRPVSCGQHQSPGPGPGQACPLPRAPGRRVLLQRRPVLPSGPGSQAPGSGSSLGRLWVGVQSLAEARTSFRSRQSEQSPPREPRACFFKIPGTVLAAHVRQREVQSKQAATRAPPETPGWGSGFAAPRADLLGLISCSSLPHGQGWCSAPSPEEPREWLGASAPPAVAPTLRVPSWPTLLPGKAGGPVWTRWPVAVSDRPDLLVSVPLTDPSPVHRAPFPHAPR